MTADRVLLVDDHPIVRAGLRPRLGRTDVEIVGEAATGEEAIALSQHSHPMSPAICGWGGHGWHPDHRRTSGPRSVLR